MNLVRRTVARTTSAQLASALGFISICGSGVIAAQAARASQAEARLFEVASVRPNKEGGVVLAGVRMLPGGSVVATNVPLHTLIEFAYGLDVMYERVEGNSSLLNQNFDVNAKTAADVPRPVFGKIGPVNIMMQNLLAERFKLVVRLEDHSQQGYALVLARADGSLGPRIRPSDLKCPRDPATKSETGGDTRSCAITITQNELRADGHEVVALARTLATQLRRPVVNRTGVIGSHEIRMTFDQAALMGMAGLRPVVPEGAQLSLPSLFTALEDQLGLKLEPQRVPARVLIVERVEPPSEN